jgi:hypothetical protein
MPPTGRKQRVRRCERYQNCLVLASDITVPLTFIDCGLPLKGRGLSGCLQNIVQSTVRSWKVDTADEGNQLIVLCKSGQTSIFVLSDSPIPIPSLSFSSFNSSLKFLSSFNISTILRSLSVMEQLFIQPRNRKVIIKGAVRTSSYVN